jgi:hypothetical protein
LDPIQGYRRRANDGSITGVAGGSQSEGDELTEFVMFLFDTVTTGRGESDGLAGTTIEGYANYVVNYYQLAYDEVIVRTNMCKKVVERIKSIPRDGKFKDPAPATLILAVLNDDDISLATRITLMLTWFFTLRLGQSTSKKVAVYNSTVCLRRSDVEFVYEGGQRTAVRVTYRHSKNDKWNHGGVKWLIRAEDDSSFCPVRMFCKYWDSTIGIATELPFLRHADGHLVTSAQVIKQVKRHATLLGLDPRWYAGHSIRIGGGTAMTSAQLPLADIMLQGGWASEDGCLRYLRMTLERAQRIGKALSLCASGVRQSGGGIRDPWSATVTTTILPSRARLVR